MFSVSFINPRHACAAKVTVCVCVCVCVCLSALILALRATRWPKSDTNGFSAILAWFLNKRSLWNRLVQKLWHEKEHKSQYASEYCLTSTDLCCCAHCESIIKGQVVSQRMHSIATYEYNYPVGARNHQLIVSAWSQTICMYLHFDPRSTSYDDNVVYLKVPCNLWLITCCIVILGNHHLILLHYYNTTAQKLLPRDSTLVLLQ